MIFPVIVYIIWSGNKYLSEYNPFAQIWVQTEIIAFCVNVPMQVFQMYMVNQQKAKVVKAVDIRAHSLVDKLSHLTPEEMMDKRSGSHNFVTNIQSGVGSSSVVPVMIEGENADDHAPVVTEEDPKASWQDIMKDKTELEYEEDFFAFTVLCYTKHIADEYMITRQKQS